MSIYEIISNLQNPPKEFSPVPFWFLNDRLEKSELLRQMRDFNDKGVNAVVVHPRIGLPDDFEYLSEEYFDIIGFIVKTARELDIKIVLYDEAMYPSGSAHGLVVKSNPDLASIGIVLTDDPSDGKIIAEFGDGKYIVSRRSGGTIRGIHYGEDDGEENAPMSANILDERAVNKFIELTHEAYYKHLSEYFGSTIIGFFTDEPCVLGRNAQGYFDWTDGIENEIIASGVKLTELRALFENKTNAATEKYRQIIKNKLNNTYYQKLSDWCAAHDIALMGHPKESDDIDEEQYFHIPGQDLIFRMVSPEKSGIDGANSVQAKCSSDAARHMQRHRNSNECFGACSRNGIPWYFTADDMKWYIDWLGVRGVNMFIPHAFYYSVEGKRKDERPPDVGPNNIWWEHYKMFSDYMKRLSYLMTDCKNCADTAILCKSGDMKAEIAKAFYENQIEFNYLPYALLDRTENKDGKLCIVDYEYSYVVGDTDLTVQEISGVDEVKIRDFHTDKPIKDLRISHIVKDGTHMYFAVNEGEFDIDTDADMYVCGVPVLIDLWKFSCCGIPYMFDGKRTYIHLHLKRRESALILFDTEGGQYKPAPKRKEINVNFALADKGELTKIYAAVYDKKDHTQNEYFTFAFDEMAECYINGELCDVSFWRKEFDIGQYLKMGQNDIKLVLTDNIAKKYSKDEIKCVQ